MLKIANRASSYLLEQPLSRKFPRMLLLPEDSGSVRPDFQTTMFDHFRCSVLGM